MFDNNLAKLDVSGAKLLKTRESNHKYKVCVLWYTKWR